MSWTPVSRKPIEYPPVQRSEQYRQSISREPGFGSRLPPFSSNTLLALRMAAGIVRVPPSGYDVQEIRLIPNLGAHGLWKQIDAVQLIGKTSN